MQVLQKIFMHCLFFQCKHSIFALKLSIMLYIYRASAGSGKTHLLTGFYLRLLFHNELTPLVKEEGRNLMFGEILAVTFTNKATAEMKERIIAELDILHRTPEKSDFLSDLIQPNTNCKPLTIGQIQSRALSILTAMLNDYSELHVSTIDSFFQQVLRSFAHEMNMQGSYEIELDANSVLDHAVSQFLLNLDEKNDPQAFEWMVEFSKNRLSEGSGWNVHDELLTLAKVLTSEEYKKYSQRIADFTGNKTELLEWVKHLKKIQRNYKDEMKRIGEEGMRLLQANGLLPTDFKSGKSSGMGCFEKWTKSIFDAPTRTLLDKSESADNWFTDKSPLRNNLNEADKQRLLSLLQEGIGQLTGDAFCIYLSAKSITANVYQLGLLSRLEKEANAYCEEQGIQLLSNTTEMLNELVKNEGDSPFIYEKTGTRIRSFMIDEFQDTSGMQWANFKPLLSNSLGEGNQDLIVGDVKQSIYRWRGSDWELLNSHINSFKREQHYVDPKTNNHLDDNWRSAEKIITFNNDFFKFAAQRMASLDTGNEAMQKVEKIYSDVAQNIPEGRKAKIKPGILHIEALQTDEGEKELDAAMRRLPEMVIALQEKGFALKDILVLTRKNSECQRCAEALLEYGKNHHECPYPMRVLTNEALRLSGRNSIRSLVAILHYLQEPNSKMRRMAAYCCYFNLSTDDMAEAIQQYGENNIAIDFLQYSNKPLYEQVESIIALLPNAVTQRDGSFLQAFRDLTLDYVNHNGPDLNGFLHWWEEKNDNLSISTPKDQDAIRIMTIHQSKGLGEKAVIIPFASWCMDIDTSHRKIIWCDTTCEELGIDQKVLPILLTSDLGKTIFKENYADERLRDIIDNLNTAYVAFTRAKEAMVIMMPAPKKSGKTVRLETLLSEYVASNNIPVQLDTISPKWAPSETTASHQATIGDQATSHQATIGNQSTTSHQATIGDESSSPTKPSNSATPLLPDLPDNTNTQPVIKTTERRPKEGAQRGIMLHAALSAVKDYDHVERPIKRLFESGQAEILDGSSVDELVEDVKQMLEMTEVRQWFAPQNQVLCETDIVTRTTHTQRPDRIVFTPDGGVIIIDFKTGEVQDEATLPPNKRSYKEQVKHYMKLLAEMGYERIEGYLWYLDKEKIVKIS